MLNKAGVTNMDKTLADYITRTMAKLELEKQVPKIVEPQVNPNDYPVYPEDDGYDTPKNPYSSV